MGFGSYFFTQSPYDAALTINGEDISYKRYETRLRFLANQTQEKSPPDPKALEQNTIQSLVQETIFAQEARRYGLETTDNELASYIQSIPAFQKEGRFDQTRYLQFIQANLRMSLEDFEEDRRRDILGIKFRQLMMSTVRIAPLEFNFNLQKKRASALPEDRQRLLNNPHEFRQELQQTQASAILQLWSENTNSRLKVKLHPRQP
jgi:hypothetical protein